MSLARLDATERLAGVDLARGLAVIGMFAVHLTTLPAVEWSSPSTWAGAATGRSSILFAMLAGVSITLAGDPDKDPGTRSVSPNRMLASRAAIIWGIGVLLLFLGLPVEVILPAYGVLFLIGIGLQRVRTSVLWVTSAGLGVVAPFVLTAIDAVPWPADSGDTSLAGGRLIGWFFPFVLWAGFLAAGMAAGRVLARRRIVDAALLVGVGALFAVLGDGVGRIAADHDVAELSSAPHSSGVGEALGSGGFGLAAIGLCTLAVATPLRTVSLPLRSVGSMPLTAYTAHLLIWWIWIAIRPVDDITEFRALHPFWPITVGVIIGCTAWAATIGRGPLETLVLKLSLVVARPLVPSTPSAERD
ncbi:DUF1624 domain-containing protein [Gordonia sp. PDNC005]|uniref:heparan-alpha-glucosaminide N-acetyltransferase domain-containing protein n=1 Tax=unclassified Gordonia (in: high G+C Gram-positive bacteria) TaxID=2657482 RepID=UPI001966A887|nr:heparan-alpha-glucosaminide N-acetyltransferase domain-containing protein [Gordonia sp. PDNC005]QRY64257.1 DUF1624 domain-containing protein [Gordonia sp. PDNC005]